MVACVSVSFNTTFVIIWWFRQSDNTAQHGCIKVRTSAKNLLLLIHCSSCHFTSLCFAFATSASQSQLKCCVNSALWGSWSHDTETTDEHRSVTTNNKTSMLHFWSRSQLTPTACCRVNSDSASGHTTANTQRNVYCEAHYLSLNLDGKEIVHEICNIKDGIRERNQEC